MLARRPGLSLALALLTLASVQLLLMNKFYTRPHLLKFQSASQAQLRRAQRALADRPATADWRGILAAACQEAGAPLPQSTEPVVEAVALARRSGFVVPCRQNVQSLNASVCDGRCIIALNLHNSQEVMPNLLVQLVRLAGTFPASNLLVSVYESGSSDLTASWLQLLGAVLSSLSVPNVITSGGALQRAVGTDRIRFLASVRQAAIDQAVELCGGAGRCRAASIVYINDVFFDASDVARLLQYRAVSDVVCGMDFEPILADHPVQQQQQYMMQHLQQVLGFPPGMSASLASWPFAFRLWKRLYRRSDSLLAILPLFFYDIWVSRDISGRRFYRPQPYSAHAATAARLESGLPVSAYCCWNGLVALNAEPLLLPPQHHRRVAFRAHGEGECAASECSLLCDDFHRRGYTRVVIDPGVRVTYRAVAAARVSSGMPSTFGLQARETTSGPAFIRYVPWNGALLSEVEQWQRNQTLPEGVECCGLQLGRDMVDFSKCAMVPALYNTSMQAS